MKHYKISKLLNDSTVPESLTEKELKKMIYQVVNILSTQIKFGLKFLC